MRWISIILWSFGVVSSVNRFYFQFWNIKRNFWVNLHKCTESTIFFGQLHWINYIWPTFDQYLVNSHQEAHSSCVLFTSTHLEWPTTSNASFLHQKTSSQFTNLMHNITFSNHHHHHQNLDHFSKSCITFVFNLKNDRKQKFQKRQFSTF